MFKEYLFSEDNSQNIIKLVCSVVFSFHIILLLLWVIALFKNSIQLRRKVRYSTLATYNQDTRLEALNSKVEYRKSLFLFVIVVCELISSIFTIITSIEGIVYYFTTHHGIEYRIEISQTDLIKHQLNRLNLNSGSNHTNCSSYPIPFQWEYYNYVLYRVTSVCFSIPIILTFSLVYTLMSYYVMVTKKSLSYNTSLESVDLAREQKVLLLVSFVMCLILLVLLVRVEVFLVFEIVDSIFFITQSILTYRYSRRLIQVLNWKIMDTKIAFGTDSYQYKLYTKTLKSLKKFLLLYNIVVVTFCLHVILHSLLILMILLNPSEMFHVYGVCIPFHLFPQFFNYLKYIVETEMIIEKIPLATSLAVLFLLNLMSIPYLLSKVNLSCRFNCKRLNFRTNTQPLL